MLFFLELMCALLFGSHDSEKHILSNESLIYYAIHRDVLDAFKKNSAQIHLKKRKKKTQKRLNQKSGTFQIKWCL